MGPDSLVPCLSSDLLGVSKLLGFLKWISELDLLGELFSVCVCYFPKGPVKIKDKRNHHCMEQQLLCDTPISNFKHKRWCV